MATNVKLFQTAKDTDDRLTQKSDITLSSTPLDLPVVRAEACKTFQTIEGIGAAFTEASSTNLDKMSAEKQEEIMQAYFGAEGLEYSLCRTHINSCDFALGNYANVEKDGDTEFETWSMERDKQSLLPMIQRALKVSKEPFTLFASPWSPPAWMKTTGKMNEGGQLKPEYRETWARYYCRYIEEYKKEGVDIWGLTVQNEPAATQTWDSCEYSAAEEKDFVRDYLGPQLEKAGMSHINIVIWDHNRGDIIERARVAYNDPEAAKYIWGTGFHWYMDDKFDNVKLHNEAYPDKKLLFTEGCQEGGPHLGSWNTGERYGRSMVNDINNGTVGWVDWNMILDETGGPNHVNNLCSAPIIVDTQKDEILYQSSYYYIGHFAKFFRPQAKRILCATTKAELMATAVQNMDGSIATVVLNLSDEAIPYAFACGDEKAETVIPARAIQTLVVQA